MAQRRIVPVTDYDQLIITREAQTAVALGDVCTYHTDYIKVIPAATSAPQANIVGVALDAGAAGDDVRLCIRGVCDARVDGDTTDADVGDALLPSTAVAGELRSTGAVPADTKVDRIICAEANAGTVALVRVFVT